MGFSFDVATLWYNSLMEIETFCYFCGEKMFVVEGIFTGVDGYGLYCQSPKCLRFGLFSAISLPENPNEEKDKEDSDKTAK